MIAPVFQRLLHCFMSPLYPMPQVPPLTHRPQQWLSNRERKLPPIALGERFKGIGFSGTPLSIRHKRQDRRVPSSRREGGSAGGRAIKAGEDRSRCEFPCENGMFALELLQMAGLDPAGYRMAPLIRRIPACLRVLRVPSVATARELLARQPQKREAAIHALLIGTSSFFRDIAVFDHLASTVIPEMVARHEKPQVWSAACSNGMELYSVAMMLASHGALSPGQLLGTDCRRQSISEAARGI